MKELHQLIHSLTSAQWQSLEKFLTCFSSNKKSQAWELAQLIAKTEKANTTPDEYSMLLYKEVNEERLGRLALNLKEKILECLISTSHTQAVEIVEGREVVISKLRRKALQYHFLTYHMKELDITRSLLDEIISIAKEYEQYSVMAEHLEFKKWTYCMLEGEKKFNEIQKEIDFCEQARKNYSATYDYVAGLKILYEFSGRRDEEKIRLYLQKAIPDVRRKQIATNSPILLYHLNVLMMDYEMLNKNYLKARSICLEIIEVVKSNKSVFTKNRLGIIYDHLAICEMMLGRFEQALEYTRYALQFIPEGTYNYAISKQWEFYSLFHGHQYSEAAACAENMITSARKKELGGFRWEKFYFLLANAHFKNKNFEQALIALENKFEIKADKDGWEFNWRVLQIMANVEVSNLMPDHCDTASKQVEGIRNLFRSNEKKVSFTPRQKNIYKFLTLLEQKGFDFSQLNGKAHNCLEQLSSETEADGWQMLSSELIRFDEWAKEKMKGKKKLLRKKPR